MRTLPIKGEKNPLEIGKILCLGKNFSDHAIEMGQREARPPVIFLKPSSALLLPGQPIVLPDISADIHFEVELVVAIGKTGKKIQEEDVEKHILGYAVGLDLTARDLQSQAKKSGGPWTMSKGFDGAAPISEIVPMGHVEVALNDAELCLWVNDVLRQHSLLSKMIWSVSEAIAHLSRIFTLERGDLIFMGTPAGVGSIHPGDRLRAEIKRVVSAHFEVTDKR